MKRTITFIIILLLLVAACIYYNCLQKEKYELEKKEAVATAVQNTLDSIQQHQALEIPKQATVAHKPPAPAPAEPIENVVEPEVMEPDVLVDERDGQEYPIFEVNGMWWMGENLNFETADSWCYDLKPESCDNWGRLYTWNAASQACPDGWHLPNDEEWHVLIDYYGGVHYAGGNLKEGGRSDFNAVMSGYRDKNGFYGKIGESAYFWSSTEHPEDYASFKGIYKPVDNVGTYTYPKADAFAVRCVKDK